MEKIFAALGHEARLWLVLYLVEHGPTKQVDLGRALENAGMLGRKVGSGDMTQFLQPVIAAGLVNRDRARGPLYVTETQQIQRMIATASALAVATTTDLSVDARERHARLMQRLATEVPRTIPRTENTTPD
jgi:hypothetical protein